MDALVEGGGRAEERFQGHGAGNVGKAREPRCAPQCERADCGQRLRPVQECEAFLALQAHWLDARAVERLTAWQPVAAIHRFALAYDAKGQVRQRREIAAGADRSLLGNQRVHAAIQHVSQCLGKQGRTPL
jgi:hypothetical protein